VLIGLSIQFQHSVYVVYVFLVGIEYVWEYLVVILQQSDPLPELLCILPSVLECMFIELWPIFARLG
jgi:hypothetical protein